MELCGVSFYELSKGRGNLELASFSLSSVQLLLPSPSMHLLPHLLYAFPCLYPLHLPLAACLLHSCLLPPLFCFNYARVIVVVDLHAALNPFSLRSTYASAFSLVFTLRCKRKQNMFHCQNVPPRTQLLSTNI